MSDSGLSISHPSFFSELVTTLISHVCACLTIPIFFLISGFLFFSDSEWSKEKYLKKLRSRANSLLVPFLFWNLATLAFIATAQAIPAAKVYFSGKSAFIASYGLWDYLNAIIGINRFPISFQFWFMRDLMALVLLSPIIAFMIKKAWPPYLAILSVCWFFRLDPVYFPTTEGLLFFSVGGWLSSNGKSLFIFDRYGLLASVFYVPVAIIDALTYQKQLNILPHRVGILLGVLACLFATKYIAKSERLKSALVWLSGVSFWVYAIHEPLLTISIRLIYKAIHPNSSSLDLFFYFLVPVCVILFSIALQLMLSSVAPKLTKIVTGGRLAPHKQKPQREAYAPPNMISQ